MNRANEPPAGPSEPPVAGARALAPCLWRWTAWHPEWKEDVGCVAIEAEDELVLVDPLLPDETAWESLDATVARRGAPAIVLTVHWHERSACDVLARYPGATLWADPAGAERLGCGITNPIRPSHPPPGGLQAFGTGRAGELVLWHPASRSLIPGDVILSGPGGGLVLCPRSWLPEGFGLEELARELAPLLDLPVERVLVAHREPVLEDARNLLRRAVERAAAGEDVAYRP